MSLLVRYNIRLLPILSSRRICALATWIWPGDISARCTWGRNMIFSTSIRLPTQPANCKVPNNPSTKRRCATDVQLFNTHQRLCHELISVPISSLSPHGLNTTVSGTTDAANQYAAVQDSLAATYTRNCQSYAAQWLQELTPCGLYSPTDVNNIISGLTGLAIQACDSAHPFGASTLPAGQTYNSKGLPAPVSRTSSPTSTMACSMAIILRTSAGQHATVIRM